VALKMMAPLAPASTMPALDLLRPSMELSVAAAG